MIKITYGQLTNPNFMQGLVKLSNFEGFEFKDAYHIGRVFDKCASFEKQVKLDIENKYTKLKEMYGKRDEEGKIIEPQGKGSFEIDDKYMKEAEEFLGNPSETEETIQKSRIKMSIAAKAPLTPQDIIALEPLLEDDLGIGDDAPLEVVN